MKLKSDDGSIIGGLIFAIFLWGAGNAGTRFIVKAWPPVFVGATRFLAAGLIFLALLRWTRIFGESKTTMSRQANQRLWMRCGLSLAVYIVAFNWAMRLTTAAHVVLYLGASPVWALIWEERPGRSWASVQRYAAALLALSGVATLCWPAFADTRPTLGRGDWFLVRHSLDDLWTRMPRTGQ